MTVTVLPPSEVARRGLSAADVTTHGLTVVT
jgi:hypothetical protein